jgi:polyisoprenoid-binding protein YceI
METATRPIVGSATSHATVWKIDPEHSTIGFSIKHMKVATVHGRFTEFRGALRFDPDRPRDAWVDVVIETASIDTGNARRDAHLRSTDFFDVATYPTITFRGMSVEQAEPLRHDRWLVTGDLRMHGVTQPVELSVQQIGEGPELWDMEVASFTAATELSRRAFGLGLNLPLDGGGLVIGDEVKVAISIQVVEATLGER